MKPKKLSFYLYAETDKEVYDLQEQLFEFVSDLYSEGIFLTADRLSMALKRFGNNWMVKQFLR